MKRLFDVAIAGAALIATSPITAVAAVLVKVTSAGPVLHRATRIGLNGEPFVVLKFRTMRTATDHGSGVTSSDDPRITAVGKILRRLKIDELPQLINVLRGDMSLVGPRPEDPRYVADYTPEQRRVLTVRPGMTSPASIAFRHEERLMAAHTGDRIAYYRERILPAKLEIDLDYVERRSFATDLLVLLRTALALVRRATESSDRS